MAKRIILDTNIWVSYALNRKTSELVSLILDRSIIILSTEILRQELVDVISRDKFKNYLSVDDKSKLLRLFDGIVSPVMITPNFFGCPDPKDNFLFDLALQHDADAIVTGDQALLNFETTKVKVISLSSFKKLSNDEPVV